MWHRKTLLAGLIAGSFAAIALPSHSANGFITEPPPAPRVEHFEPVAGKVVIPGEWTWRDGRHVWSTGYYVPARKGYWYEADHWVQVDNDQWVKELGGWQRDDPT